jgi:hypothetical protein
MSANITRGLEDVLKKDPFFATKYRADGAYKIEVSVLRYGWKPIPGKSHPVSTMAIQGIVRVLDPQGEVFSKLGFVQAESSTVQPLSEFAASPALIQKSADDAAHAFGIKVAQALCKRVGTLPE